MERVLDEGRDFCRACAPDLDFDSGAPGYAVPVELRFAAMAGPLMDALVLFLEDERNIEELRLSIAGNVESRGDRINIPLCKDRITWGTSALRVVWIKGQQDLN